MLKRGIMCIMLVGVVGTAGMAAAVDTVYVTTADGHLLGLRGITPGWSNLGGAGDTTFADINVGQPLNCVAAGNAGGPDGLQVVVGSATGNAISYTAGLSQTYYWDTNGPGNEAPVTEVAVGSIGGIGPGVVVGGSWSGSAGTTILFGNHQLIYQGHISIGGSHTTGLAIGELDPARPGNEVLATSTNLDTLTKGSSVVLGAAYELGAANNVKDLWGWWSPSNVVSDVVVADFWPGEGAGDDFAIVGNIGGFPDGRWGDGAQGYTVNTGGALPGWKYWSNLDREPEGTVLSADAGDVFGDPGLELVMAGDSTVYIIDGDASGHAATLQPIQTNQPATSVVVADVLRGDGIDEIVVGMANGVIFAYEHTNLADMNSAFGLDPDNGLGAIFVMDPTWSGAAYSVTDMAVPEPATMSILLIGTALMVRRRRH